VSITIEQLLIDAQQQLASISDSPKADAQYLLAHVLQKPRSYLRAFSDQALSNNEQCQFKELLARRLSGEPVAYVIGQQGFWNLVLSTSNATLIPRPETEMLVEAVLPLDDGYPKKIVDLGVGSGAIVLALAREKPHWQLFGSDISAEALMIAKTNCEALDLKNVEFRQGSWCEPWQSDTPFFDVVVSNPPYIRENDPHLTQGDVRFEPRVALVSGADGLDAIRVIVQDARALLKKNGWLFIEHGFDQGQLVREIFAQNGFTNIETLIDLNGHDRVCQGQNR
jgi:release factor glutamine methyltransferase